MVPALPVSYQIHEIVSVVSDVALPELESFRVPHELAHPSIRLQIGRPGAANRPSRTRTGYTDGFAALGFAIEIERAESIEITASKLLRYSPHVLYTNVVEPVLRWLFVERGYALVHGACVARDGAAILVTARTDTGKTTTVLRLLDHDPSWSFLSDDLTLVAPNGIARTYPKPLTISRHTVSSVRSAQLSPRERATLPLQSRLHSKSGRRFALFMTKTGLPMATTNALTQLVVPPPKYDVRRLVPGANVTQSARLAGMVVIERGADGQEWLRPDEAVDTILANSDDAFTFPPYSTIAGFLYGAPAGDLRPVERATVAAAFRGLPATLLRSSTRDWWRHLPSLLDGGRIFATNVEAALVPGAVRVPAYAGVAMSASSD